MNTKKSNSLIVLVAILGVIVLGLVGYIVYDKVANKETPTKTAENVTEKNESQIKIESVKDFPKENDSSVLAYGNIFDIVKQKDANLINFNENFTNKAITIENVKFTFNCSKFENNYCSETIIKANGITIFTYQYNPFYTNSFPYVLLTKDYIIINETTGGIGNDTILIYDKLGILEKEIEYVADIYVKERDGDLDFENKEDVQIKLVDNKLYFVTTKDLETAEFNYYDFATKTINKIEEFSAWTTQQA